MRIGPNRAFPCLMMKLDCFVSGLLTGTHALRSETRAALFCKTMFHYSPSRHYTMSRKLRTPKRREIVRFGERASAFMQTHRSWRTAPRVFPPDRINSERTTKPTASRIARLILRRQQFHDYNDRSTHSLPVPFGFALRTPAQWQRVQVIGYTSSTSRAIARFKVQYWIRPSTDAFEGQC